MAPNKTLAAQLYGEMKSLFPDNAVEYFVSYYDYYTPEAYVPRSDTFIEKESSILITMSMFQVSPIRRFAHDTSVRQAAHEKAGRRRLVLGTSLPACKQRQPT